jgi:hypothetical protein
MISGLPGMVACFQLFNADDVYRVDTCVEVCVCSGVYVRMHV